MGAGNDRLFENPRGWALTSVFAAALFSAVFLLLATGAQSATGVTEHPGKHSRAYWDMSVKSGPRPRLADYRFDFSLSDDTVIRYQAVWLRVAQTNITNHDVPWLDITVGGPVFRLRWVDSSGTPLRIPVVVANILRAYWGTLKPGESEVRYVDLATSLWYSLPESLQTALVGRTLGVVIDVAARVFTDGDSLSTHGPPLPLTVMETTGEEVEATALLKRAMAEGLARDYLQCRATCREIIRRFPQSRLIDEAFHWLSMVVNGPSAGKVPPAYLDLVYDLARMKPSSPQITSWAAEIKYNGSVTAYNDFVAELRRRYPTVRALDALKEEQ